MTQERIPYKSKAQKDAEKKRNNQKRYFAQKRAIETQQAYKLKLMLRED